jgi:hypothetical protein
LIFIGLTMSAEHPGVASGRAHSEVVTALSVSIAQAVATMRSRFMSAERADQAEGLPCRHKCLAFEDAPTSSHLSGGF